MTSVADPDTGIAQPPGGGRTLTIDVVELNPHAPRPFAFTEVALCLRWIRIHAQRAAAHAPVGRPPTTRH